MVNAITESGGKIILFKELREIIFENNKTVLGGKKQEEHKKIKKMLYWLEVSNE